MIAKRVAKKLAEKYVKVEMWYDRASRNWVVQKKDADNNQVGDAHYCFRKSEATDVKREWEQSKRVGARIKWVKTGDPDDPTDAFYESADKRFTIEPTYHHTVRPSGYKLIDNQTKQKYSAYTLADARSKAEAIVNPPKKQELIQEYYQAEYNKWVKNYPDFAEKIAKKGEELGFVINRV